MMWRLYECDICACSMPSSHQAIKPSAHISIALAVFSATFARSCLELRSFRRIWFLYYLWRFFPRVCDCVWVSVGIVLLRSFGVSIIWMSSLLVSWQVCSLLILPLWCSVGRSVTAPSLSSLSLCVTFTYSIDVSWLYASPKATVSSNWTVTTMTRQHSFHLICIHQRQHSTNTLAVFFSFVFVFFSLPISFSPINRSSRICDSVWCDARWFWYNLMWCSSENDI